ncbi:MAG: hypothetical protein LKM45_06005 [Wolbachia endosymbiont of Alcedoecus sp.]|nr:hypothetical protein [Wolbachia endosymbiont of Alcedoecus sp.]
MDNKKISLVELAKQLENIFKMMKCSVDMVYYLKKLYENERVEVSYKTSKRKPLSADKILENIEREVIEIAVRLPTYGQESAAKELQKKVY